MMVSISFFDWTDHYMGLIYDYHGYEFWFVTETNQWKFHLQDFGNENDIIVQYKLLLVNL